MKKIDPDYLIHVKPVKGGFSVYKNDQPVKFLNQNFFLDQIDAERAANALRTSQLRGQIEQIIGRRFFSVL